MNKLVLFLILIIFVSGCVQQGEGIFLEASIVPESYEWSNIESQQYGFIQNERFGIEFTATKYLKNTDGLMTIQITLPEAVNLLEGDIEWQGNDVTKKINLEVEAAKKGKYEIEMKVTNTENEDVTTQKISICVGEDVEEIKSYCTGEIPPPPLPA